MKISWLNFYILPIVCLIGLVIELLSTITFYKINSQSLLVHRRKPIKIYEYLFFYSISNFLVLCINILFGLFNCGPYCRVDDYLSPYFIKQFERFAKIYLCNTLNTFNILIEFRIALDRYDKLIALKRLNGGSSAQKNLRWKNVSTRYGSTHVYQVCLLLLVIGLAINTPYIFLFKIDTSSIANGKNMTRAIETATNTNILAPDLKAISEHPYWFKLLAVVYFLKDTCFLTLICALNAMISISVRNGTKPSSNQSTVTNKLMPNNNATDANNNRYLTVSSKMGTTADLSYETESQIDSKLSQNFKLFYRRKERKVSHMILFLSILLLVGNLPETFYRIKRKLSILFFTSFDYLGYYLIISNIISFVSSYFKLFIYLHFSKTFLKQFKISFLSLCLLSNRNRRHVTSF